METLYFLDQLRGAILSCNSDGTGIRRDGAVLSARLGEAIGIAISHRSGKIFVSTLQGSIYSMNLDGGDKREFVRGVGRLTGICYHGGHD